MGFRLIPKSVTLNDLEQRNDRYLAFFRQMADYVKVVEDRPIESATEMQSKESSFQRYMHLWRYSQRLPRTSALLIGTCAIYIYFSIMTRLKVSICSRFDRNRPISTIWLQCKILISILCSSRTVSLRQLSFLSLKVCVVMDLQFHECLVLATCVESRYFSAHCTYMDRIVSSK